MCTGLKGLIKSTWLRACCSRHYGDVIVFEKLRFLAGGQFRRISVDGMLYRTKKSCVFRLSGVVRTPLIMKFQNTADLWLIRYHLNFISTYFHRQLDDLV